MRRFSINSVLLFTLFSLFACRPAATPQPTVTPSPEVPSSTETLMPTSTSIPYPTLSVADVRSNVNLLMETNGGCELPCWWGITPGITTWDQTLSTFQSIAPSPDSFLDRYGNSLELFNFLPVNRLEINKKQNIVQSLSFLTYPQPSNNEMYTLLRNLYIDKILKLYGEPSSIFLLVNPALEPTAQNGYLLWILYETNDFAFRYEMFTKTDRSSERIEICLSFKNSLTFNFYSGSLKEIHFLSKINDPRWKALQDATDLNVMEFTERTLENNEHCFETGRNQWVY